MAMAQVRAPSVPRIVLAALLALGLTLIPADLPLVRADALVVDGTDDDDDAALDGVCAARTGFCTLRAAIQEANGPSRPGPDAIYFNIGGPASVKIVNVPRALPPITESVTIDGTSQPCPVYPCIELRGNQTALPPYYGIEIRSGDSTIRGLALNRFNASAIALNGGGNQLDGNYIGTDITGTHGHGNVGFGVIVLGGANDLIGGPTEAKRNVIAGNRDGGIVLYNGVSGVRIQGNSIGLGADGAPLVSNDVLEQGPGIWVASANNTVVGGPEPGARNVIAGPGQTFGVLVGAFGPTSGSLIEGNYIGIDPNGRPTGVVGFIGVGIGELAPDGRTWDQRDTVIRGNVIGLMSVSGIRIAGGRATGTRVERNLIGTDPAGAVALQNGHGVVIDGGRGNTIGGTTSATRNVISGSAHGGVRLVNGASENVVQGNYIGTNAAGLAALPNGEWGVLVLDGTDNTIGGTTAGAGNLISGNRLGGIDVAGGGNNRVQGNLIGTNAAGTAPLPNGNGVADFEPSGVRVRTTVNTAVGDAGPGARNVIAGNNGHGVFIRQATGTRVRGNSIGTTADGAAALGNRGPGVRVDNGPFTSVGGTPAGAGNLIRSNTGPGVTVANTNGVAILSNGVGANGGLGIELVLGANNAQPPPDVASAIVQFGSTTVTGSLAGAPGSTYTVQFFANSSADESGFGEGERPIGTVAASTTDSGTASFSVSLPTALAAGQLVTATATDPANNTSGFSRPREVIIVAPQPIVAACASRPNVRVAVARIGDGRLHVTVTASSTELLPSNTLRELRFGAPANGLIDVPGHPPGATTAFDLSLPAGTITTQFVVRRATSGLPTTVPFVVVDDCGDWRTFVGGGPSAF